MQRPVVPALFALAALPAAGQSVTWQWRDLKAVSSSVYEKAMQQNQGIVAMDSLFPQLSGFVGSVSVEKLGGRTTHFPILQNRRAHTGILTELTRNPSGAIDDDDDVLMYVTPNPGDKPLEDYLATGRTKATEIEGEIDVNDAFAGAVFRFGPRRFTQFSGYGPFVHEKHNYFDTRPHDYLEIHPCENIWWTQLEGGKLKYTIGLFSDNSGLFDKWRPNPLLALDAIAFEWRRGSPPLTFTMQVLTSLHLVPYPLFDDHANEHTLKDGNDVIATIKEAAGPFSIDFARVTKTPLPGGGVSYKGFLKIHSAVKDGGHAIFSVERSGGPSLGLGVRPSTVTVTLKSIRCIRADDDGGVEELYGAYGVSAVTGQQPFHANVLTPGTTNGILWERGRHDTVNLRTGQTAEIGGVRTFSLPASGELVLAGDLSEEDEHEGGDNDRLGESHLERVAVRDLQPGVPRTFRHRYASGRSDIEVLLTVERKDALIGPPGGVVGSSPSSP